MALPDRYPPPSPHRSTFLLPSHPSSYPERNPRYRGPAPTEVEQWGEMQRRWIPAEDHYGNEYLSGSSSNSSSSPPERPESSPLLPSNAPFYVPRSPPMVNPYPQYQNQRSDYRMDIDPAAGYEYDHRVQYHPGYLPPLPLEQHLPPSYLQPQIPIYDSQPRWPGSGLDRPLSPDRSRPPFIHGQRQESRERERLAPLRPPPPPPLANSMQRSYSQGRPARAPSSSRRNPYPPNDGRGRVSSGSRYQGGGKRRFEKRSGHGQRGSGH